MPSLLLGMRRGSEDQIKTLEEPKTLEADSNKQHLEEVEESTGSGSQVFLKESDLV